MHTIKCSTANMIYRCQTEWRESLKKEGMREREREKQTEREGRRDLTASKSKNMFNTL